MTRIGRVSLAILASGAWTLAAAAQSAVQYHVVSRITIGTYGHGFYADFITIDAASRRLFGLGNAVVDVDQDKVVDSLPGKAAGGYALAPDLARGFTRKGTFFDLTTLKVLGRIGEHGDASVYDPVTHRTFLFDRATEFDPTVTVIDMRHGTLVAKRAVAPGLESAVADGTGKLFINREDSSIVTKVDARTVQVEARYPVPQCARAQGLSLDRIHRRLFLGCEKQMVVVNADNGAVVARIPVTGHADENAFDPGTQLAFNANAPDSTLTIVHEDSPDAYTVVGTIKIGAGSRSVAVDPVTHKVYAFYYDVPPSYWVDLKGDTAKARTALNSTALMAVALAP
jgi:DNA-binding beta-propeller fold protein YncE